MRRPRKTGPVIALLVLMVSVEGGLVLLGRDVAVDTPVEGRLPCGGVFGSLAGKPLHGGEIAFPEDWVDRCRGAALDQARWGVVPAGAAIVALGYLGVAGVQVVRRAKAEGRSTGALTG